MTTILVLHNSFKERELRALARSRRLLRRVLIGMLVALIAHLFFIFILSPYLKLFTFTENPTEVVQITQDELAKIKAQMRRNKYLPPVLEHEMDERARVKEPPKDALHMGKFNQQFKEQTVAGAQRDAPEAGGGAVAKADAQKQPHSLSSLGFGQTVPKPIVQTAPGQYRPVGRESPQLRKSNRNNLNTVENEYYSFFARFEEPIIRNWYFLIRSQEGHIRGEMQAKRMGVGAEFPVTVEFTIDRKGDFKNVQIIRSSSLRALDMATLNAVKKLTSLPNPPPGLFEGGQYFTYRLDFLVLISDMPMSQSSPGLDWN